MREVTPPLHEMPGAWPSPEANAGSHCSSSSSAHSALPSVSTQPSVPSSLSSTSKISRKLLDNTVQLSQQESSGASHRTSHPSFEPDNVNVNSQEKKKRGRGGKKRAITEESDYETGREKARKINPEEPPKIPVENSGLTNPEESPKIPAENSGLTNPKESPKIPVENSGLCRVPYELKVQICKTLHELSSEAFQSNMMNVICAVSQLTDKSPQLHFESILFERVCINITYGLAPRGVLSFSYMKARASLIKHLHVRNDHQHDLSDLFILLLEEIPPDHLLTLVYRGSLNPYTQSTFDDCIMTQRNLQMLVIPTFAQEVHQDKVFEEYDDRSKDYHLCSGRRWALRRRIGTMRNHYVRWFAANCLQHVRMYMEKEIPGRRQPQLIFVDKGTRRDGVANAISDLNDQGQVRALTISNDRLHPHQNADFEGAIRVFVRSTPLELTTLRLSGINMENCITNLDARMTLLKLSRLNLYFCGGLEPFLEKLGALCKAGLRLETFGCALPIYPGEMEVIESTAPYLYTFVQSLSSSLKHVHLDVAARYMESDMEDAWNDFNESEVEADFDLYSGASMYDEMFTNDGTPRPLHSMPIREQSFYRHWSIVTLLSGREKTVETLSLNSGGRRPSPEDMYALRNFTNLRGLGVPFPFIMEIIELGYLRTRYERRVDRLAAEMRYLSNLKYLYLFSPRAIFDESAPDAPDKYPHDPYKLLLAIAHQTLELLRRRGIRLKCISLVVGHYADEQDYWREEVGAEFDDGKPPLFWKGASHLHVNNKVWVECEEEQIPYSVELFGNSSVFNYDKVLEKAQDCVCRTSERVVEVAD